MAAPIGARMESMFSCWILALFLGMVGFKNDAAEVNGGFVTLCWKSRLMRGLAILFFLYDICMRLP